MELPHRINSPKGFTVVELLLIVIIISIIGGVVVPKYTKSVYRKQEVYATAHAIAADLRYARRLSIGEGLSGNSGKTYWMTFYSSGPSTDSWKIFEYNADSEPIKFNTVLTGITLTNNATATYYFDSKGKPFPEYGGSIDVADSENLYRWRVSVIRGTGRIQLTQM